jgi:hypothetical protein
MVIPTAALMVTNLPRLYFPAMRKPVLEQIAPAICFDAHLD